MEGIKGSGRPKEMCWQIWYGGHLNQKWLAVDEIEGCDRHDDPIRRYIMRHGGIYNKQIKISLNS